MSPLPAFYRSHSSNYVSDNQETLSDFFQNLTTNIQKSLQTKQSNIYEEVYHMMGQTPPGKKYTSVEQAVADFRKRTGLEEHLKQIRAQQKKEKEQEKTSSALKSAQDNKSLPFEVLQNVKPTLKDNILRFIQNKVRSSRGQTSIPAVQEAILSTFRSDGVKPQEIYDQSLAKFINLEIIAQQLIHPKNDFSSPSLGKEIEVSDDDGMNSDFFYGLNPKG